MACGGSTRLIGNALTRGDILGCLWAVVIFTAVLLSPGYLVGWVTNLIGFRGRGAVEQLIWSVALSFAVVPLLAVMVAKYASMNALALMFFAGAVASIALNIWALRRDKARRFRWQRAVGMSIGLAWVLFVIAELVDVGVGNRLYLSVTIFDHALRAAFVDAVMRTGVPPVNPLYWPGHAAPMRYYYFWYVLTAAAARLAGVTARQAMIASAVWSGFGLAAVVALYCRHFLAPEPSSRGRRWPRIAVALALLAVTGLDLLPALAKAILRLPTDADMDWWSPDQVTSWMDSLLWVPHHIAGLICCLFGFLLVWMSKGSSRLQRAGCGVVAGIAFASAFGLSTWVAAAFAMVMTAWMLWVLAWEPESRTRVPVLLGAGLVAVLALTPYLAELRHAAPAAAPVSSSAAAPVPDQSIADNASHLLRFSVRHMIDPDSLLALPWFAHLAQSHPRLEDAIAGLVLLLPGYFVELGFFGLVLVVALRASGRMQLGEATRASLALAVAGLVVSTFLRSTVIANNDFGTRSILIAQFFLLLLAVSWCEGAFAATSRKLRTAMLAMAWIGVAGTVYQAAVLRFYLPVEERLGRPEVSGLAERAMALRRAFDAMDRTVPKDAVIQFNTAQPGDYFRYVQLMQARRQMATAVPGCATSFGGGESACPGVEAGIRRLFATRPAAISAVEARTVCGKLGVNYLIATRWDGVWAVGGDWVWALPAMIDTGDLRVLSCGSAAN